MKKLNPKDLNVSCIWDCQFISIYTVAFSWDFSFFPQLICSFFRKSPPSDTVIFQNYYISWYVSLLSIVLECILARKPGAKYSVSHKPCQGFLETPAPRSYANAFEICQNTVYLHHTNHMSSELIFTFLSWWDMALNIKIDTCESSVVKEVLMLCQNCATDLCWPATWLN